MPLNLAIPPPLCGTDPGSFAYATITERLPRIGRRVVEENAFPPEVEERLLALLEELPHGKIRLLRDAGAPDAAAWAQYVKVHLGQTWLEAPWFFAETYFYRRILEATGYFEGPEIEVDPFRPHKEQSLAASREEIHALARRVQQWQERPRDRAALQDALMWGLWGNQGDLSMWPGGGDEIPSHEDEEAAREHVLVDERDAVVAHLEQTRGDRIRVDILEDNAGFEFMSDLALVDALLGGGWADSVVLDVKFHPTFVSDVIPADVRATMRALLATDDEAARTWGQRLRDYADAGRLTLRQHAFWTSPLAGWEMPAGVQQTLAEATLVISKGDANYRRLLGDRHWDYTTPFAAIVRYFPAPLLALRTLKSNVAAGLDETTVRELSRRNREWDVSGEWGVIQFAL